MCRHCETKNFDGKTRYLLLCIKIFDTSSWETGRFFTKKFGTFTQKKFDEKSWFSVPSPFPLLINGVFQHGKFSETEWCLFEKFQYCETKNIPRKIVILSPLHFPPLIDRVFQHENFSGTEWCLYKKFQYCETKNIRRKIVIIRFMHVKFRWHSFSETQKRSCTKIFGTVRQNILDGKLWYSLTPPSYPYSFAIPESFWNAEGFVYKKNLVLWDKKNLRKNRHTPLFVRKTFRCRKNSEIKEGNFPGDKKISTSFSDNSLYVSTTFSHPANRQNRKTSETPKTSWSTKTARYQYFSTGLMRNKSFSNFSVDTVLYFTEIFALDGWVASTFSQLLVFLHIC